ncbi:MAG: hypothetical protein WCK65_01170 [Rhodospirillaceae bacterium]
MREFRCIVFTETEALNAIINFRRKSHIQLPVGTVASVVYTTANEAVTTKINLLDDHNVPSDMIIDAVEMAAALVSYCLDRKIPMSKMYDKKIELMEGQITLVLTMIIDMKKNMKQQTQPKRTAPGPA